MSTILSEFNPNFKTHQSKPSEPKNTYFTCLACQVAFPSSDNQRAHYRTDWHKYNLKRKMMSLNPVSNDQFVEKVLAQQAKGREEQEKQGLIYECPLCKKSYLSENAYNNHVQSKKHLELEQKAEEDGEQLVADDEQMTEIKPTKKPINALLDCLFCSHNSIDLDSNLNHMSMQHGFFLPDVEYLKDREGLVNYLSQKIQNDHLCLYCNGRGKSQHSAAAARAHMLDRGHCKMAYDESEDPEELLKFYDFGTANNMDLDQKEQGNELVLDNGVKLGHRKFLKYYKQNAARKNTTNVPDKVTVDQPEPETLRRKERRHLITDGKEQGMKKTADGIKEASISKDFTRQLAYKQNNNQTLRARIQNPI